MIKGEMGKELISEYFAEVETEEDYKGYIFSVGEVKRN
jgi:hypothetical protein